MSTAENQDEETTTASDHATGAVVPDELVQAAEARKQELLKNPLYPRGAHSRIPDDIQKMDERNAPTQANRNADAG